MINQQSRIIAIDPGVKGAMAYCERNELGAVTRLVFYDLVTKKINGYNLVSLGDLATALIPFSRSLDMAIIEDPFAIPPKDGYADKSDRYKPKTSSHDTKIMFMNFGRLQAVLEAIPIDWVCVSPSAWKAKMGLNSDKEFSRETAMHKYPIASSSLKLKKHNDRAEALLLAEYAHFHVWLPSQLDNRRKAFG